MVRSAADDRHRAIGWESAFPVNRDLDPRLLPGEDKDGSVTYRTALLAVKTCAQMGTFVCICQLCSPVLGSGSRGSLAEVAGARGTRSGWISWIKTMR